MSCICATTIIQYRKTDTKSIESLRPIICKPGPNIFHVHQIIHRDIKPENLLVSLSGVVKLADLGYSRKVLMNSVNLTSWAGTPVYMPPEILLGETKYST